MGKTNFSARGFLVKIPPHAIFPHRQIETQRPPLIGVATGKGTVAK